MPILRAHDQFYTQHATATLCWEMLRAHLADNYPDALFLEPSAGAGAFYDLLPKGQRIGVDLEPRHPDVEQADFLQYELPEEQQAQPIVVVGNPPFGRNSSLAVKFVNRSAQLAEVVAFILPKTFMKAHFQRKIDRSMHLVQQLELPAFSFVFEGEPWDVPCVFQIWVKRPERRVDERGPLEHDDFCFVKRDAADFAIRRVGRSAGMVLRDFAGYSKFNHHFIKASDPEKVIRYVSEIDWSHIRSLTAGVPCVGKEEIVKLYSSHLACQAPEKGKAHPS